MRLIRTLGLVAVFSGNLWAGEAVAGGTVDFAVVEQLLREQPATYNWLSSTLIFPPSAFAEVRFGSHFASLGGGRAGPYSFVAQRRGSSERAGVEVALCTKVRFLDAKGEELPNDSIETAARIDEHLVAVLVRDVGASPSRPPCQE